jgi:DNA-binding response OmpR family regulator
MGCTIFIVDSSPAVRRMVEQTSAPEGYEVVGFQDGPSALDAARKRSPALIIADYHLDNMTFSGFCKEIGKQDNLAETMIVSIVDAADRLDESKLRSLGVRSFLKKPFQGEQLLEAIRGVLNGGKQQSDGKPARKRTWPPVSTATDNDENIESGLEAGLNEDDTAREGPAKEWTAMTPSSTSVSPLPPTTEAAPSGSTGDDMMKGLFDHLLQSVVLQANRKIGDLLPSAIAQEVAGQIGNAVQSAVQEHVAKHVTEHLKSDKGRAALRDLVKEELDRRSSAYMVNVEATVRQSVADVAAPLVEKAADRQLRELADAGVKQHLPTALRDQMSTIDTLIKSEIQQAAASCARQAAEEIVREMVLDPIRQAVQRIVPDVAESQVREEIKRLSAAD